MAAEGREGLLGAAAWQSCTRAIGGDGSTGGGWGLRFNQRRPRLQGLYCTTSARGPVVTMVKREGATLIPRVYHSLARVSGCSSAAGAQRFSESESEAHTRRTSKGGETADHLG
jgi:hypothetical protein